MQIGKIIGTVVSTQKDEKIEGMKLQLVQFCNVKGEPVGGIVVAADAVGAGIGEIVLTAAGSSARLTPLTEGKPIDTVIMAIVDIVTVNGAYTYQKEVEESEE